ncbi:MAG: ABC transrane type-1 protein [Actinobacteria bacterium]|jgi:multiple sugar transport system permease protein|nr:ABC transrane type-1 protein [Actinomycetota bacterium]
MSNLLASYKKTSRLRQESRWATSLVNLWLIAFALISIIPMIWLLLAPTKSDADLTNKNPLMFGRLGGYIDAWKNLQFFDDGVVFQWALNSIWYTAAIVVIATISASLAGFVLTASNIRFKKVFLISTLIMMLVPPMALVVPVFVLMDQLSLMDNPMSVILVASLYPFGTFLAYIYYSTTIPKELYESARLDGCNDFRLYSRIALPLSWPLISLLSFFAFIGNWANYFLPYILLPSSENYTLPIGLGFLFYSTPAINPGVGATSVPVYKPEIALAGVLIALPIMIVFLVSQKRLVRGMLSGSIKE